ncbi:intermediate cleavage peptidase Icp55 [Schizosaccharomyces cryophilus OY26]|uniref:Intermediate cleavage peptidase Icp55 n=1 Tax=Schizosaccharomyces cryophilus (strain OY26 / ATCC MYA-4695 / CBS 11777 / NBRC 106824 / NRRL Y48691) TaxID=653667 RepID=S9VR58_SCHCR|nr:intermediate cleavage peptidase Icp55 [Schizosaccharomyces cryophilus OY26]EPY50423.1 intermediate cleavage peptidase Icp55 [Schizosaccharomyces cryophilus OY26]
MFSLRSLSHGFKKIFRNKELLHSLQPNVRTKSSKTFGQPTSFTRPHILRPGELTPKINADEYRARRNNVAELMQEGDLLITTSAAVKYMCGAAFYEYHQDPNFYYLTGCLEPESVLLLLKEKDTFEDYKIALFLPPKNSYEEKWEGFRTGVENGKILFHIENIQENWEAPFVIEEFGNRCKRVFYNTQRGYPFNDPVASSPDVVRDKIRELKSKKPFRSANELLHPLRTIKSESEISCLQRAASVSGNAYKEVMRKEFPGESQLAAELEYRFKIGGCQRSAYVPVVAGGRNGLTIHYTANDDTFQQNDMVLVDAGGEYGGYVTDISRTWPTGRGFTPVQRDLYQAVLNVQKKCIELCTTSTGLSLARIHYESAILLKEELKQIGIYGSKSEIEDVLYPHSIGHEIGLEIHDCFTNNSFSPLKKNQIVTIEPGIYVPMNNRWPKWAQGIAIRIEDSVVVGEEESLVLTKDTPKEVKEIQSLREEITL